MSYHVVGNNIRLTRGDTFVADISIINPNGEPYEPSEGDTIRFAMKRKVCDLLPIIVKDIPIDTLRLTLLPEDTKTLDFGVYLYDVQLTKEDGTVDTFITKSQLTLTEEVH